MRTSIDFAEAMTHAPTKPKAPVTISTFFRPTWSPTRAIGGPSTAFTTCRPWEAHKSIAAPPMSAAALPAAWK